MSVTENDTQQALDSTIPLFFAPLLLSRGRRLSFQHVCRLLVVARGGLAVTPERDFAALGVEGTDGGRLGAGHENLVLLLRAIGGHQVPRLRIDRPIDHVVRTPPVDIGNESDHAIHVRGPDGYAGVAAGQANAMPVVEADPHQREDARRVADEPGVSVVARRPGLSGKWAIEAQRT